MALQLDLDYAAELAPHEFERFASLIDPSWIDEALQQTGTVSVRRRRLPAERMVWLVIGLALFRNEPVWHIVQQLDLADGPTLNAPVPSAVVAGRERLGEAPMAWLFEWLALAITTASYHWPLQTPGTFPKRLALLREQARAYLLPERRTRSYPRAVKQPRSKFPMKNASQLN